MTGQKNTIQAKLAAFIVFLEDGRLGTYSYLVSSSILVDVFLATRSVMS